ncbi:MAG: hypothetical protein L6Q84_11330 [Polyangiaceae bacterium]|nr:hypothetical protein [Polyangiaceae bacterium]
MKLARVPFLFAGASCLFVAISAGLARLGLGVPAPDPALHGVLMVSGFFGTLIGLERAVAHGAAWTYLAPGSAALSGAVALAGAPGAAAWVAVASSACFSLVSAALARRHVTDFTLVLVLGGLAWTAGNASWALGAPSDRILPWSIAFLTLTIFAERRELGRVLSPSHNAGRGFLAVVALVVAGALALSSGYDHGRIGLALGLCGMALWLVRFDVARHTVKKRGLTRFMAVALIAGYVWLAIGGVAMLAARGDVSGARFDAFVHALMLGFVFSMVFAHAPIIFPAVIGAPLAYSPAFYLHLGLLQLSLMARLVGDFTGQAVLRTAGGIGNALAIVLFVLLSASAVARARKRS